MKIVRSLDEEVWGQFVAEHPAGSVFHTPEMCQVFSRTKGYQPELWAATEGGSVLALLLPVRITLMSGLLRFLSTRSVVNGSVLHAPGPEGRKALSKLLHAYRDQVRGAPLFTELRNLSDLTDVQSVLNECGFTYEEHLNFLIDLDQPEETIWGKISKSGRQRVRTSRNKGTVVEEVTERKKVNNAYQLLSETYARADIPLASLSLFEAAFDILGPKGMLKIFLAGVDEQYCGARLLLPYSGRIIDWYAGFDRAFSSHSPNELLVWHALQWGKEHNFHLFDFGGAGKPGVHYGPRDFKAKFGGELVNYGRNICVHAPLLFRFSNVAYRLVRRFM